MRSWTFSLILLAAVSSLASGRAVTLTPADSAAGLADYAALAAEYPPLVILPELYDSTVAAPLLIALHGYGADGRDIASVWRAAASEMGAILAAPDALRATGLGVGFAWFDPEESDYRVRSTVEYVAAKHRIDRTKIALTGFSQGATIALAAGLSHPELFRGVIPVAGNWTSPALAGAPRGSIPRIYLMIGEKDDGAAGYASGEAALRRAGYDVRRKTCPGVGHTFPPNAAEETRVALEFALGR